METTVTLQPPFEYALWVLIVGVVITIAAIALFIAAVVLIKKNRPITVANSNSPVYRQAAPRIVLDAKRRYCMQIQEILNSYEQNTITKREGYQRLSLIIRGFVHETTGINVENCTLIEIKKLGIPQLNELIQEYYVPEFAEDDRSGSAKLNGSCNRAMGVIKAWN